MSFPLLHSLHSAALLSVFLSSTLLAATLGVSRATPNLPGNIERPLRYQPEGQDFVVENGGEFFNRPLYGGNTAFRVDAGDMPEFSLYLPGHGGNLRFGLRLGASAKWLHECRSIRSRYRPGTMLYEIRDPLLGEGAVLRLHAIALHGTEGLVVKLEGTGLPAGLELLSAFGGLSGKRGARDGDIGTEAVPIGQYFQLKKESCLGNSITLAKPFGTGSFTLDAKAATLVGQILPNASLGLANAENWSSPGALLESSPAEKTPAFPVVLGRSRFDGKPIHVLLQRVAAGSGSVAYEELATYREVKSEKSGLNKNEASVKLLPPLAPAEVERVFAEAESHFKVLRSRVSVETPDPFLNAAVSALNVGVDAVWDESQKAVMHGAIAWRTKLLGWRGPYALDALGWHGRAREHFAYWATRQNTQPIPASLPPADENANLARNETGLHSNGDLSNSHYDMNLVYIDALFRHLQWTGDLEFAATVWPVIERHLAWERRLFRREFGPRRLPLYEAYAAIWASDDLQYSGGGSAHGSAYNHYHNQQAARLARLLGKDATPYEQEASLIAQGMRELLWMPGKGMFAEFRDLLGLQRLHESPALWSYYHTMDAALVTPREADAMSRFMLGHMRPIPIRGAGVPYHDSPYMMPTTDWMPYTWSLNNVVLGENMHTALGLWQAGLPDEAYRIVKGSLLASMYMGICPGNVGTMNYADVYRRESQRDFADGGGMSSRALVEGLFGLRPDALAGQLVVSPGLPSHWKHASLTHPDFSLSFQRDGNTDSYVIGQQLPRKLELVFRLTHPGSVKQVLSQGAPVPFVLTESGGLSVKLPAAGSTQLSIEFAARTAPEQIVKLSAPEKLPEAGYDWARKVDGVVDCVDLAAAFNAPVTRIFRNEYRSPRSPYVSLAIPKQGIGYWAGHVKATADIDDKGLRELSAKGGGFVTLANGVRFATPPAPGADNIVFTSLWDNYPAEARLPLSGSARRIFLLMAGSTNAMQSRIANGEVLVRYTDGSEARLTLRNPETWWPIEQDYLVDAYQFPNYAPIPPRLDLRTGQVRMLSREDALGRTIPGGAATLLQLELDPGKVLKELTLRTLSNEVVIGLMAASLER